MAGKTKSTAVTVELHSPQPKKHVVRYDNHEDGSALRTVYVAKDQLASLNGGSYPERIRVEIAAA